MIKFYDTNALLLKLDNLFDEFFAFSSVSLSELEGIKTSATKDEDTKFRARRLLHLLDQNPGKYDIHIFRHSMLLPIEEKDLPITNDMKILATAFDYDNSKHPDDTIFITNDMALKCIANLFFGQDSIGSVEEEKDDYTGYVNLQLSDEELENFYSDLTINQYKVLTNQYLVIRNKDNEIIDKYRWLNDHFEKVKFYNFNSRYFGQVKPMPNDVYQQLAADSFMNNKITMIKGPAGSGKTYLALGFLMYELEQHKIDKIIVFCNTVATKNSAKLGFYPGTRDEKLLDSQIGNLLSSKFGGKLEVERMISEEKLVLLPLSDIRGYDTTGMRAGVYISEAQNLDVSLMKLALQRIGDDSICIIDGDEKTQVDDASFSGVFNGMRKASKIFRGHDIYGEVELKNIHRSEIARIAENM